jgi:hypothetical protein
MEPLAALAFGLLLDVVSAKISDSLDKLVQLRGKDRTQKSFERLMKEWRVDVYDIEDTIDLCESKRKSFLLSKRKVRKIDAYRSEINEVEIRNSGVFLADFSKSELLRLGISAKSLIFLLDLSDSKIDEISIENSFILHLDLHNAMVNRMVMNESKIFNLDLSEAKLKEPRISNTSIFFRDEYRTEFPK